MIWHTAPKLFKLLIIIILTIPKMVNNVKGMRKVISSTHELILFIQLQNNIVNVDYFNITHI